MAVNSYFDWALGSRFIRFDTVRAEDVNASLDLVTTGFTGVEADIYRAIKLPEGTADQLLNYSAVARKYNLVGFDSSGNATLYAMVGAIYLGAKAADPTTDNFGQPLAQGYLYYNTTVPEMRVYTGSAWITAYNTPANVVTTSGATMLGALWLFKGANIASAATVNLDAATGNFVHITGTTNITAVTLTKGPMTVIFDGALTLTHHATNNNLPGAANITTAAADRAIYWSDGTTVYCIDYVRAATSAYGSAPAMRFYTPLRGTWTRGASFNGTYVRTNPSFTATVTHAAHGRSVGDYVYLDFTSGTGVDGWYAVASVVDANNYTVTTAANATTSGNVTEYPPIILTVTSEASHNLVAAATHAFSFGVGTDLANSANLPAPATTYIVRQVTATTLQLDGTSTASLNTRAAGLSGVWMCHTSTRSITWSKPSGLVAVRWKVWGGGGQGFCAGAASSVEWPAQAGSYTEGYTTAASLGATETVTVGKAGSSTAAGGGNGETGATSSFGAWGSAPGGLGGGVTTTPAIGAGGTINLEGPCLQGSAAVANSTSAAWSNTGGMGAKNANAAGFSGAHATQGYGTAGGSGWGDGASSTSGGMGTPGLVIVEEIY